MRTAAFRLILNFVLVLSLILPSAATAATSADTGATAPSAQTSTVPDSGLYRTRITVAQPYDWARLEKLGVLVLEREDNVALALVDGERLETLARLGFRPEASDELNLLLSVQGPEKDWLRVGMQPLVEQGMALQAQKAAAEAAGADGASAQAIDTAQAELQTALAEMTPEQQAGVAASPSVDQDGDGLTDTQEGWWCTEADDDDTDDDGMSDGAEIQTLRDWMMNRLSSAPIGTPWPTWPFNDTTCPDKDFDSVPNLAERWDLGLNMDLESTDNDKFDDGQELFSTTKCPGSGSGCGYGGLPPASNDPNIVLFPDMPGFVKAPGRHPLVAAYPVLAIDVVESSLKVQTVTTVTTDHVIASGTEKSYSTAKTEGTSTSLADTVTWNDWQEVSTTSPMSQQNTSDNALAVGNAQSGPPPLGSEVEALFDVVVDAGGCLAALYTGKAILETIGGVIGGAGCVKFFKDYSWVISEMNFFDPPDLAPADDPNAPICYPLPTSKNQINSDSMASGDNSDACDLNGTHISNIGEYLTTHGTSYVSGARNSGGSGTTYVSNVTTGSASRQRYFEARFPVAQFVPTKTVSHGSARGGAKTTTTEQYEEQTVTNGEAFSRNESWGNATAEDSAHAADLWFSYKVRNTGTEYAREIGDLAFNVYLGDDPNPIYTYFVAPDLGGDGKFHNFIPGEEHTYSARTNTHAVPLTLEMLKAIEADPSCEMLRDQGQVLPYDEGGRCPGGKLRIMVEDFTYGADELFYEDAAKAGVLVAIEDGVDDGSELIDTYLIPTWGEEKVLDVLARYFPHSTDEDGQLIAIWTPEYRADTPAWCVAPKIVGTGAQRALWCKHALSTADWWNIYTDGMGDGSEGMQDTPASPGSVALFRFNKDSDLDGYSDRSEEKLGTDANDSASYPKPELIAGVHSARSGNNVVATLSLLNTGLYDAYGVEAVMIAANDTISITNNTVGGSGRVRAQRQVIVGSRIVLQTPLPQAWLAAGHAKPSASGYYINTADRTYTFTVQCANPGGCDIGAGSWSLNWNDGAAASASLNFGSGYASPTPLAVGAFGLKLGMLTGKVYNGESFTVAANTPRDTFQYTIAAGHENDYTAPLVIVSFNDPQGNHRFVIPPAAMAMTSPDADLIAFSGQMLPDVGADIVTTGAVASAANAGAANAVGLKSHAGISSLLKQAAPSAGAPQSVSTDFAYQPDDSSSGASAGPSVAPNAANTVHLVVSNPSATTLTNAHLFLEFVNISGTVVSEIDTPVASLSPGPTSHPVTFDTASFDPAYNPNEDYIVMAFLTDYQGNILDTAGRPLSSFQEDPTPEFDMAATDETWDFGTAQQGTLLQRTFMLGSVGYMDLLTYLGGAEGGEPGIRVEGLTAGDLPPGDMAAYKVTLNTQYLPTGPYLKEIHLRTSDPVHPTRTITIRGTITPMPDDAPGGATIRPLDVTVNVPAGHSAGEWYEFTHTLGPQPETLHPVKVYSQDYGTLKGVGKYAPDFEQGTVSYDMFGDGRDGDLVIGSGQTVTINTTRMNATASGASASPANSNGFSVGDTVLFHQTQGTDNVGRWEYAQISAINSATNWTLARPLAYAYTNTGGRSQVIKIPKYRNVHVQNGGVLTTPAWDGWTGGILVFLANGSVTVDGVVDVSGKGFRGGISYKPDTPDGGGFGQTGENISGNRGWQDIPIANGGGGGIQTWQGGPGGGGGGHDTAGANGGTLTRGPGIGGLAVGAEQSGILYFGGGGGGGARAFSNPGGYGGTSGGIVIIEARTFHIRGVISGRGDDGIFGSYGNPSPENQWGHSGGGGGGAGGSIRLIGGMSEIGMNRVTAVGGVGGASGGDLAGSGGAGSNGRIHIEYCDDLPGETTPPASKIRLNCYIIQQIESAPYTSARLNLPESGAITYQTQYGRKYDFTTPNTTIDQSIRLPKQLFSAATMDVLVNNTLVASGDLTLTLDLGANNTIDWSHNQNTTFPATFDDQDITAALNAYLVSRTDVAWDAELNVPFKLTSNRQAQVLLTDMKLTLQVNQPSGLQAASVDVGADRPLDVPIVISEDHNQGETYDFTHTLGPNPESIHPCKVYDQSGSVLKGVGKDCSDFGSSTVSIREFGTGRDGDLMVVSGQTAYTDNARKVLGASASAGQNALPVDGVSGFDVGAEVLVIQMRGDDAGRYEFGTISGIDGGLNKLYLQENLEHTYTVGGNSKAQAVQVPHYRDVTVQSGAVLTAHAWDGSTGGIVAFRSSRLSHVDGTLNVSSQGFWGAPGTNPSCGPGNPNLQGGSYDGSPSQTPLPNFGGGGGGDNETGHNVANYTGGGGGGYGTAGSNGLLWQGAQQPNDPGQGGSLYGTDDLSTIFFGSGGGQSGNDWKCSGGGAGYGGNGGGIILVSARDLQITGVVQSNGQDGFPQAGQGGDYGGGGGAGGSVLLRVGTAALGEAKVTATGGRGGLKAAEQVVMGGQGAVGRIHIEYCSSRTGTTNPVASEHQINCYTAEQVEQSPYTTTRLYLPESGANTYQVQFGRRYTFTAAGQNTKYLQLKRQVYSAASLDALVSNTGVATGNLNLCVDIGNDGVCDFTHSANTTFPATLNATGLANALNTYLLGQNQVAWGDPIDVPVRVQVDRQADVMLTNLALTPVGAKTRFLRLPAQDYSDLTLGLKFGQLGTPADALAFTVDVGAEGAVDWSYSGTPTYPATLASPNLAAAFNSYLVGRTGDVDVPIRIVPSPSLDTALVSFSATPTARPDLTVAPEVISVDPPSPVETDPVTVSAVLHNVGSRDSGPAIASFYATPPGGREWYIGSDFIANVPGNGGSAPTEITWNTAGFTGDVPVRVVIDPFNRVAESNEANNQASKTLTIKTRPDLRLAAITPGDPEPVTGESVQVSLPLRNDGQTASGASVLALYNGNPAGGGTLICQFTVSAPANGESPQTCAWTPSAPGQHRLFAVADRDRAVNEANEGNNQNWLDVTVGFAGPILVDSGAASDQSYTPGLGYGYLNGSASAFCGADAAQTQRTSADGKVEYRFDHLLPGHFYHLDLTLLECDGIGRLEQVYVNGNRVGDAAGYDLTSGDAVYPSIRLDPALYTTGSIIVTITELNGNDAVVAEVSLHDIDYRYTDSGKSSNPADPADPRYPYARPGRPERRYGWLDGVDQRPSGWGTLPYQTRRIDLGDSDASDDPDNELRYQFDGLSAGLRYQIHLTFYQKTGGQVQQTIGFDEYATGVTVDFTGEARKDVTVDVPPGAYTGDGSIVLKITRTGDGVTANAFVNEVALEQLTSLPQQTVETQVIPLHTGWNWVSFYVKPPVQPATSCTGVTPTSAFTNVYGQATLAGQPVAVGALVEAYTPAGVKVGCFEVTQSGLFGYMRVYGAEGGTPGMQPGEPIRFRINGIAALSTPDPILWQDDRADHELVLAAPDVIPIPSLLSGIAGKYSRVLCETGTYLPPPGNPIFNTCTTMEPGRGYLIYMTAAATLTLTGPRVATDTPLSQHSGWNWLGYLPTCTLNVPIALPSIDGKYSYLHGETGTYRPPPANPAFNTLTAMGPGRGYMIYLTQAATLTYPANLCGAAQNQAVTAIANSTCPAIPTSQFTSFYGRVTSASSPLPAGAGILAYSPRGQVVGCGAVQEDGLYGYLRVYGADDDLPGMSPGEAVSFTVAGMPAATAEPALWQNDFEAHEQDLSFRPFVQFLPHVGR